MPDNPHDYVMVRHDPTGHHYPLQRRFLCDETTELDQSPFTPSGTLRAPIYNVPKGQKPAPSAKTAAKRRRPPGPVPTPDQGPEENPDGRSADTTEE